MSARRPRGEAADLVLEALKQSLDAGFGDMTIVQLREATQLPEPTLRDNISGLRRKRSIETYRDDDRLLWVRLSGESESRRVKEADDAADERVRRNIKEHGA